PEKRNAIDDPTVFGIETFFAALPDAIKAVVLAGEGEHFCAGLDLTELTSRDIAQGIAHSPSLHRAFERIEFGKAPVGAGVAGAGRGRRPGPPPPPPAISAWPRRPPITPCRKAAAAFSSAAAGRCACRGSSAPRA